MPGRDIGLDGNDAPLIREGMAWETWVGLNGRLRTRKGRMLLDPAFGLGLADRVDSLVEYQSISRTVSQALQGVENLENIRVTVEGATVSISIEVGG